MKLVLRLSRSLTHNRTRFLHSHTRSRILVVARYGFMIGGLEETEQRLRSKGIPFSLLAGFPKDTVPNYCKEVGACAVVTDMSPLKTPTAWAANVAAGIEAVDPQVPLFQVDAHNVVPVWVASPKQEYAARTIRPKITQHLSRWVADAFNGFRIGSVLPVGYNPLFHAIAVLRNGPHLDHCELWLPWPQLWLLWPNSGCYGPTLAR
jgi:deoxyribodipyrimidine photolyase